MLNVTTPPTAFDPYVALQGTAVPSPAMRQEFVEATTRARGVVTSHPSASTRPLSPGLLPRVTAWVKSCADHYAAAICRRKFAICLVRDSHALTRASLRRC